MDYPTKIIYCERCKAEVEHVLAKKISADGMAKFGWYCRKCERFTSTIHQGRVRYWIKDAEVRMLCWMAKITKDDLPTVGSPDATPCNRCGATTGVQYHHIAPQALFKDSGSFGTIPLCPKCHVEIHRKLDVAKIKTLT